MDAPPPITGVAEVVLSVRDLPAMREFYREVLGFPVHSEATIPYPGEEEPKGQPTISFLTIRDVDTPLGRNGHPQLLALIDHRRHAHARTRLVGHDVARSTLNHLAFEIPPGSYRAHLDRLESLGLAPEQSEFPDMEARAIFFCDPEGNRLELICHHVG